MDNNRNACAREGWGHVPSKAEIEARVVGTPWVGAESLSWFYSWCRAHGISGDNHKLKAGLIAGVFGSAAVAVHDADTAEGYSYFIFPARLERWAAENAIDYR